MAELPDTVWLYYLLKLNMHVGFIETSLWFVLWQTQVWFQRTAISIGQPGQFKSDLVQSQDLTSPSVCWASLADSMQGYVHDPARCITCFPANKCLKCLCLLVFVWFCNDSFLSEFKTCFISLVFCKLAVLSGPMCKNCCHVIFVTF